jgi:E3 ubiquitin-protein ligase RNF14
MAESAEHFSTRKEEILALSSIYDELVLHSDDLSGFLVIPVEQDIEIPLITGDREDKVRFLPGITFHFSTGDKYPESEPPEISIRCSWLSTPKLHSIESDIRELWMEEICLFNMIDELSERAKMAFGMEILEVSNEEFNAILEFSEKEELKQFNETTYFCEICLEHKKGIDCYKLPRCGHISCNARHLTKVQLILGMS